MKPQLLEQDKSKKTTIVLADDHKVVRQGLRAVLEANPSFRVIGEAGEGLETTRLAERLRPDVLVLDLMMPGLSGLEVTRQVKKRSPKTHVVVLSMHRDESYVLEALKNGAAAYVLKDSSVEELVKAVIEAVAGRRYLSPPLSESAIDAYVQRASTATRDRYDSLSSREREVLQLAAEGHTNAEIGKRLFISPRTVEIHRANMMQKLGLRNQTDLIRYALKRGILSND
ncbi:MAG TPA: response regulator transcription factor [Candidatus Binatia bacterium]